MCTSRRFDAVKCIDSTDRDDMKDENNHECGRDIRGGFLLVPIERFVGRGSGSCAEFFLRSCLDDRGNFGEEFWSFHFLERL